MQKQLTKLILTLKEPISRPQYLLPILLILISSLLVYLNHSWIFEKHIVETFGDQQLYYQQALNIFLYIKDKSQYTIGYALFYLPFIYFSGFSHDWHSIMPQIIFVQAFILVPLTLFLIFRNSTWKKTLPVIALIILYFFINLIDSVDPLTKYNLLGLIPLSEPLAIFFMILCYFLHFSLDNKKLIKRHKIELIIGLGFSMAFTLMIRNTFIILLAPIFLLILWDKNFKLLFTLGCLVVLFYIPQLLWNYWVSHSFFFSGYQWIFTQPSTVEKYSQMANKLYGISIADSFSLTYLKQNSWKLISSYVLLIYSIFQFKIWKTRFGIIFILITVINIIFYLAYWWSGANDLIDRFLMPNYVLLFFVLMQDSTREFKLDKFKKFLRSSK